MLTNLGFDKIKHSNRTDILQVRYSYNSPFAIQLRKIFETTSKIVEEYLANRVDKKLLVIPAANKEYLSVYASSVTNTLMIDCLRNH